MKQLIASNVFAAHAWMKAPEIQPAILPVAGEMYATRYFLCSPGYTKIAPGAIIPGPEVDSNTTVCLLDGDDGEWLRKMAAANNGTVREVEVNLE